MKHASHLILIVSALSGCGPACRGQANEPIPDPVPSTDDPLSPSPQQEPGPVPQQQPRGPALSFSSQPGSVSQEVSCDGINLEPPSVVQAGSARVVSALQNSNADWVYTRQWASTTAGGPSQVCIVEGRGDQIRWTCKWSSDVSESACVRGEIGPAQSDRYSYLRENLTMARMRELPVVPPIDLAGGDSTTHTFQTSSNGWAATNQSVPELLSNIDTAFGFPEQRRF